MKPPPFEYSRPASLAEALDLLARHGDEAKVLAGGQSLVPVMNFRLAQPARLIDLDRVGELAGIEGSADSGWTVGAMTRVRALERHVNLGGSQPLLAEAVPWIAHPQIRNRGTVGGSLAHADPAAELPAVSCALGARLRLRSTRGERTLGIDDFLTGLFATALEPDELLTAVELPAREAGEGSAFVEVARRHGDYALAGVAAVVRRAGDGTLAGARLVYLSLGDRPVVAERAAGMLVGEVPGEEVFAAAAEAALEDLEPRSDVHATAEYKRHLARTLGVRALRVATNRAEASA